LALSEGLLITIGGLFGGGLIAWGLSQMLIKVLTGVFDPPPSIFAIPWGYLTVTVLAVVAALSTAAMVSARASTRPAVEELRDREIGWRHGRSARCGRGDDLAHGLHTSRRPVPGAGDRGR
jgi:hypothetical protein